MTSFPNPPLLHSPSLPPRGNSFLGVINVPLCQNPVTRATIPGSRLGLIEMQMLSPGPRRRATAISVGSFWQLWSVLYQVGRGNYVFVAFVVRWFNCHKFIVVLRFLVFSLDHSAKDGNWWQRADFFLEETLTWIENKFSDLMLSDWLWSCVYWWVHDLNMAANGRSTRAQSSASMYIHNKRWTGHGMAVYNFSWKKRVN